MTDEVTVSNHNDPTADDPQYVRLLASVDGYHGMMTAHITAVLICIIGGWRLHHDDACKSWHK
jgi:hypothetical protein